MSSRTCPKCQSEGVKPVERWRISSTLQVAEPPQPVWACSNPTCLHKWPREHWARLTSDNPLLPRNAPKKDSIGDDAVEWALKGQSLVRRTAESFGFVADPAA